MPGDTNMDTNTNISADGFISAGKEIDVDEIMNSIKKRIREKKDAGVLKQREIDEIADMELLPLPDFLEVPNVYEPHLYPEPPGADAARKEFRPMEITFEIEEGPGVRGIVKKILIKIRKIIFPLIRFMVRPIYNELKQFGGDRYNLYARNVFENTVAIDHYKRLVVQGKEYIKLLHNALNNMIVEFSKLKIEEELLKTKIKVLADRIEFLESRERAIEKKIFTANDNKNKKPGK